jgi:hypothetical protein
MNNFTRRTSNSARVIALLLLAFALRIYAADLTWIDADRVNPHGIGVANADALLAGDWRALRIVSDPASIGIPNGPVSALFWTIVALLSRDIYVAVALGLMASTLTVALLYRFAAELFGRTVALVAATLLAVSAWSIFLARGAWQPMHLALGTTLTFGLLATGITRQHQRRFLLGCVVLGLTALSYVPAFALYPMYIAGAIVAGAATPSTRGLWLRGGAILAASLAIYACCVALSGGSNLFATELFKSAAADSEAAARVTAFTRDPAAHVLRLATGSDYALMWTDPRFDSYALRLPLSTFQSGLLSVIALVGLALAIARIRQPLYRLLLVWLTIPTTALLLITAYKPEFEAQVYYALTAAPAMFLICGVAVEKLLTVLRAPPRTVIAACVALIPLPAWDIRATAPSIAAQPFHGNVHYMPLRWATRLGDTLTRECDTLAGIGQLERWWHVSLAGRSNIDRRGGFAANTSGAIWSVPSRHGVCAIDKNGVAPPGAQAMLVPLNGVDRIRVYRALPAAYGDAHARTNIGWSLMNYSAPERARVGETIAVRHDWRVDALPDEPHWFWYYAPFVRLVDTSGRVVASLDTAPALEGWEWRVGEVMRSEARLTVPADLVPGAYTLVASLFDPNQGKNAIYFEPAEPGKPVLELRRAIRVTR